MSELSSNLRAPSTNREADSADDSLLAEHNDSTQQPSHERQRILPRIGFREKLAPAETVLPVSDEQDVRIDDSTSLSWRPSFFRLGPLPGLISLLFVLLSIPASGAVLQVSDDQPVSEWKKLKPNVYIAVFTGIGNKALAFAALQGAIITWWLRALNGTTLHRLHRDWAVGAGSNLWSILTAGITAGNLGISTLCAGLIFVDGILLQAATSTKLKTLSGPLLLNATIAPEIPTDYTGTVDASIYGNYTPRLFANSLQPVYMGFTTNSSIPSPVFGCPELCRTHVQAAALFPESCTAVPSLSGFMNTTEWYNDDPDTYPPVCAANTANGVDPRSCPMFSILLNMVPTPGSWETVGAWIGYTDDELSKQWAGNFDMKLCTFRPAIANYSVMVGNGSVTVDFSNPAFMNWANNTDMASHDASDGMFDTTLGGIIQLAKQKWDTTFSMHVEDDGTYDFGATPLIAANYMANPEEYYDIDAKPLPRWNDPAADIRTTLNELMFRTSVQAAQNLTESDLLARIDPGLSITTQVYGTRAESVPAFHTRWRYYAAASAIQLACVLLVAWTYWGYWSLGRPMSLSPLEIAKAFDAPLLKKVNSNMRGKEISGHVGDVKVQYGAVGLIDDADDVHARRLIFHMPEHVDRPKNRFSYHP